MSAEKQEYGGDRYEDRSNRIVGIDIPGEGTMHNGEHRRHGR
jgi:hypothetical protein